MNGIEEFLTECTCDENGEFDLEEADQESGREINHVKCFYSTIKSEARKLYEDSYREENQLNERFRCFVLNFKRASEGENTRRSQVDSVLTEEG